MTGIHSRVLNELEEVLTKIFSIIYLQSWVVPVDWKSANVTPCTRIQKDDPGHYGAVSLTMVLRKVMEQIILSAIMQHILGNQAQAAWVWEMLN